MYLSIFLCSLLHHLLPSVTLFGLPDTWFLRVAYQDSRSRAEVGVALFVDPKIFPLIGIRAASSVRDLRQLARGDCSANGAEVRGMACEGPLHLTFHGSVFTTLTDAVLFFQFHIGLVTFTSLFDFF